jgi:hypothetical protein
VSGVLVSKKITYFWGYSWQFFFCFWMLSRAMGGLLLVMAIRLFSTILVTDFRVYNVLPNMEINEK